MQSIQTQVDFLTFFTQVDKNHQANEYINDYLSYTKHSDDKIVFIEVLKKLVNEKVVSIKDLYFNHQAEFLQLYQVHNEKDQLESHVKVPKNKTKKMKV